MNRYKFTFIALFILAFPSYAQKFDYVEIDTVLSVGETSWCHSLHCTKDGVIWADFDEAIYRSIDAGLSWEAVSVPGYPECAGTSLRPLNGDTAYYCAIYTGFYRTLDGGESWEKMDSVNLTPNWFHFFDFQEGIQFEAIPNVRCDINQNYESFKIWKTTDGGDNWNEILEPDRPAFLTGYYKHFANNMNRQTIGDTILFGAGSGRVFMSHDRGNTWTAFYTGLGEGPILNSIAIHRSTNIAVLAPYTSTVERKPRISYTNDGGNTWTNNIDIGTNADGIAAIPGLDSSFLLLNGMSGPETGLYITHDGGKTFSALWEEVPCHCITFVNDSVAILSSNYAYQSGGPYEDYLFRLTFRELGVNVHETGSEPPGIHIYPNPSKSNLYISINPKQKYSISITSLNGYHLTEERGDGTTCRFDLSSFQKGVYLITIRSKDLVTTRKIIKL